MKSVVVLLCVLFVLATGCYTAPVAEKAAEPVAVPAEPEVPVQAAEVQPSPELSQEAESPEQPVEETAAITPADEELGPYVSGPLTDELYEVEERTYCYENGRFGVASSDYEGPAPLLNSDDCMKIRLFNILQKPQPTADFELNFDSDEYEATNIMPVGTSYVSRDGFKITVDKVFSNKVRITLTKVSKDLHVELCPDCEKAENMREHDGVYYWLLGDEGYTYGKVNKETNEIALKIFGHRGDEFIVLRPNETFTTNDGIILRFLFGSSYVRDGKENGYAAVGYLDSYQLPNELNCLNCTRWLYMSEGETQTIVDGVTKTPIKAANVNGKLMFTYGKETVELPLGNWVYVNKDVSAVYLEKHAQYWIGLKEKGQKVPELDCSGPDVRDVKFGSKNQVRFNVGNFYPDSREDKCLDEKTMVKFACKDVPVTSGRMPVVIFAKCDCRYDVCQDTPTCKSEGEMGECATG